MSVHISSLYRYVASHAGLILVFDETIGDIRWKHDPMGDPRYLRNYEPYLFLLTTSIPAMPPPQTPRTRYGIWEAGNVWSARGTDVFMLGSTKASEGLVGLVHLWKWVRRMIVRHHWQTQVVVGIAPEYPGGSERWYTLGISAGLPCTSLVVHDRAWTVPTAMLLAADLESAPRLESDLRKCLPSNQPSIMGGTPTPQTAGPSSAMATISGIPSTSLFGASHVTNPPATARPTWTSETAVNTPHRTQQQVPGQAWTAPAPPRLLPSTTPIGPSARPARLVFGTQDSPADPGLAVPPGITAPGTYGSGPTTMNDPRYQEMPRSPIRSFSRQPRTKKPTKKQTPNTTSYKKGHKRDATEIAGTFGSPVRVGSTTAKSLRLDKSRPLLNSKSLYPISPDTSDEENLDPNLTTDAATGICDPAYVSTGEQSVITMPARQHSDRAPLGEITLNLGHPPTRQGIHVTTEVEKGDQQMNQPSDLFTGPPLRPEVSRVYWNRNQISDLRITPDLPSNSPARSRSKVNLVERPISPSPGQSMLARPMQHSGPSRSVPDSPGQAGTGRMKERRADESCKRCNVRKIKCTRTIPYLVCATCIDLNLECEIGSIGRTESCNEKAGLPLLADMGARTPSIDIPTGSLVDTGPDTQAIAGPSSESLLSHEQYGHDRRLDQALEVENDVKPWIREEVPRTKRPWGDVAQGGDQF